MTRMKKIASILLALVMVMAVATASAATITIEDAANVPVAGKTFNAYKILDLELVGEDGYVYTVPAVMEGFYATRYDLDAKSGDFDYEVVQKIAAETDMFAFATAALAAAKTAGVVPATATAGDADTAVTMSDLPLGYYVIEDMGTATPISALMLDSTNPDLTVTIKADKPSIDKKIDGVTDTDPDTTGKVEYNNAAVGDKVPYELTSKVPSMVGYDKYFYVVTDTLSKGLVFQNDVAITIGTKTLVKDTDFTVTVTENEDGTTTVKIVFLDFIQYANNAGDAITITYSAIVDEDAVIGVEGNHNKVNLIYSNNPNEELTGENEPSEEDKDAVGTTPDEVTYTYVTEVIINKVDDQGNKLSGAEFTIEGTRLNKVLVKKDVFTENAEGAYWLLNDGTYTTTDPNTEGIDASQYASTTTKYAKSTETEVITTSSTVTATATVDANGKLVFSGLAAGEYTITEIKAPDGYNLLAKPINLTIGWTAPEAGSTDCTWSYTWSADGQEGVTGSSNSVEVVNKTGTELPSTGGMGTTILYVAGGLLIAAALIVLVAKRRTAA